MIQLEEQMEGETLDDIIGAQMNRETPLGEYLGAKMSEAFDWTTIKQLHDYQPNYGKKLTKEEWEASPFYREGIPYDEDLTEVRAQAYSENYDLRRYRDSLIERSPTGLRSVLGFGAAMLATAVDPINYVPFLGQAARAKAVAKMGIVGGRAATSALEAAAGTALTDALVAPSLIAQGEDVGWEDGALDIIFGAAVGGLFGAAGGAMHKHRLRNSLPIPQKEELGKAFEKALSDLAVDEPVDVSMFFQSFDDLARMMETTMASSRSWEDLAYSKEISTASRAWENISEIPEVSFSSRAWENYERVRPPLEDYIQASMASRSWDNLYRTVRESEAEDGILSASRSWDNFAKIIEPSTESRAWGGYESDYLTESRAWANPRRLDTTPVNATYSYRYNRDESTPLNEMGFAIWADDQLNGLTI